MSLKPEEVERWRTLFNEHDVDREGILTGAALVGFVSGVVGEELSAAALPDVLEQMVSTAGAIPAPLRRYSVREAAVGPGLCAV